MLHGTCRPCTRSGSGRGAIYARRWQAAGGGDCHGSEEVINRLPGQLRPEWAIAMSQPKTTRRPQVARPHKYDPLELAAFFCEGTNKGMTAGAIATEIATIFTDRQGQRHGRKRKAAIEHSAAGLTKAVQRAREKIFRPWNPKAGEGIHLLADPALVAALGQPMFMGRPLPRPVGLEPRVAVRPGRPKKAKT